MSKSAFISYSHKDEDVLDRLHTHLHMMRRNDEINTWYDRDILAGQDLDGKIASALAMADIFLAIISADFLASNYCFDVEMNTAFSRHESGSLILVPIIAHPCDWQSTPIRHLKALPKDGKPISLWDNQDLAYLNIVAELRRSINVQQLVESKDNPLAKFDKEQKRNSKYRVQKEFDVLDKRHFADKAYDQIKRYFINSTDELNNAQIGARAETVEMSSDSFTSTVVNQRARNREGHITIHRHRDSHFGDISYVNQPFSDAKTSNGHFSVNYDEYELFLSGGPFFNCDREKKMSNEEVAKILWRELLQYAGITQDESD